MSRISEYAGTAGVGLVVVVLTYMVSGVRVLPEACMRPWLALSHEAYAVVAIGLLTPLIGPDVVVGHAPSLQGNPAIFCRVYSWSMRASRLVSLLLLLQTRGQLTAAELSGHLGVSQRTIQRDAEALAEAGVPIQAL